MPKNSHECVHCGERFPFPLRLPPKVLKDKKALEAYVHQHIFPKVSASQKDYLTQFFTTIFSDDFESNNFNAWTGTTCTAGETLVVQNALVHHGGFAAEATTDGSTASEAAYCYHTLASALSELYARLYVNVVSHDLAALDDRFHVIKFFGATGDIAWLGWRFTTKLQWYLLTRNGTGYSTVFAPSAYPSPVVGQWYCVELYWLKDALAGIGRAWVDGKFLMETTGKDTDDYGSCIRVGMGIPEANNTVIADVVFDCCVISDAYVGPEELRKYKGWNDWWYDNRLAQILKRESRFPKFIPRKFDTPVIAPLRI